MGAKAIASQCPIEELFVLIGGRWKPVILWWLAQSRKPLRFKMLRQNMSRISQKVLTQQLRELERDQLVRREMFAEMPVRVEYSLTPLGKKLYPVLRRLDAWSREHIIREKNLLKNLWVTQTTCHRRPWPRLRDRVGKYAFGFGHENE